jgi:hypothetical protein
MRIATPKFTECAGGEGGSQGFRQVGGYGRSVATFTSEICRQPLTCCSRVSLSVHAFSSAHLHKQIFTPSNNRSRCLSSSVVLAPLLPRSGKAGYPRVVAVDCVWSWNYVMMQQRGSCCLMHTHSAMTTVAGTLPGGCVLPALSPGGPSRICSCMPGPSPRTACPSARRLTRASSIGLRGRCRDQSAGCCEGRLGAARRAL